MPCCNFTMLVRNRLNLTKQALASLKSSGCMNDVDITIFDDASDEPTADFLEAWCMENGAFLLREEESCGTGIARNSVIYTAEVEHGRHDFLYLSDNDVYFYPSWLEILIMCYNKAWNHDFRVIGAYNHPFHQPTDTVSIFPPYEVKQVGALALQSMLMTWDTWDSYGPFDKTPVGRVCMGEDVGWAWKLDKGKKKLGVVSPPVLVNTGITNSFGEKIPGWEMVKSQAPSGVMLE